MDIYKTDRALYTPHDFILWNENGLLELTPKFQRRSVWAVSAQSYLIDTMLRGMTIPPLYLRLPIGPGKKSIREVVDGQQRVRSVLEFIDNEFRLSKTIDAPWAGRKYSDLSDDLQQKIMTYSFSAEIFHNITDQQIFEVFGRLNMNAVPLNNQELRNGKYFGRFKHQAFKLALEFLEFWRRNRVFTEQRIARMLEVELTSELLVAGMEGMQDKKKSLDEFYLKYDKSYPKAGFDAAKFTATMTAIARACEPDLSDSMFRRGPLFYTLYCVVFHRLYGMPNVLRKTPKRKALDGDERAALRAATNELSQLLTDSKDPTFTVPTKYKKFVAACQRQTDNITPRKERFDTLYDEAFA